MGSVPAGLKRRAINGHGSSFAGDMGVGASVGRAYALRRTHETAPTPTRFSRRSGMGDGSKLSPIQSVQLFVQDFDVGVHGEHHCGTEPLDASPEAGRTHADLGWQPEPRLLRALVHARTVNGGRIVRQRTCPGHTKHRLPGGGQTRGRPPGCRRGHEPRLSGGGPSRSGGASSAPPPIQLPPCRARPLASGPARCSCRMPRSSKASQMRPALQQETLEE